MEWLTEIVGALLGTLAGVVCAPVENGLTPPAVNPPIEAVAGCKPSKSLLNKPPQIPSPPPTAPVVFLIQLPPAQSDAGSSDRVETPTAIVEIHPTEVK